MSNGWKIPVLLSGGGAALLPFPSSIPDLQMRLLASGTRWQESARSTPAVTNGDPVGAWDDASGNSHHALQATSNKRASLRTSFFGKPSINFRSANTEELVTAATLNVNQRDFSVFMVAGRLSYTSQEVWVSYDAAWLQVQTGVLKANTTPTALKPTCDPSFVGIVGNASGQTVYLNDSSQTVTALSAGTNASSAFYVARYLGGGFNTSIDFYEILNYNRALTAQEVADLKAYAYSNYNIQTKTKNIVFDGDSLTFGYSVQSNRGFVNYPTQLITLLPDAAAWRFVNFGISGQTFTTMNTNAAANVDPFYSGSYTKNICVAWGGTNDMTTGGASAADTYDQAKTYWAARRLAGWKVIAITMLPNISEPKRTDFNNLVRSDSSLYDALADVETIPAIGATGAASDTTYFAADGLHMNEVGYALLAGLVKTAVLSI